MIECKQKNKRRWSIIVKVAKYSAILGGIFTLLDGLIWYKTLRLNRFDIISLIIISTIYIVLTIVKLKNRIKNFWKIFPNLFIIIFIYHWLVVCIYIIMYFSGPFERNYVAPNITKEKILSLKVGDDKKTIIKSFGYPGDVEFPNRNISEKLDAKYDEMFIYASKGLFGGFKFHIVFRGDKLIRAHIKLDGEDVYECQGSKCPRVFDQQRLDELCELSRKSGH